MSINCGKDDRFAGIENPSERAGVHRTDSSEVATEGCPEVRCRPRKLSAKHIAIDIRL